MPQTAEVTDAKLPLIVVDAANVVGSRPDGWWRDRAGAARRLLGGLGKLAGQLPEPTELVAVLEGAARAAARDDVPVGRGTNRADGLRIVLATGSGDDEIVAVVAAAAAADATRAITVVTADRELRKRVEAYGATTVGPRWLLDRLDAG